MSQFRILGSAVTSCTQTIFGVDRIQARIRIDCGDYITNELLKMEAACIQLCLLHNCAVK
jgi:hypothetical protein